MTRPLALLLVLAVALLFTGCDDFEFYTLLDGAPPGDLSDPLGGGGVEPAALSIAISEATLYVGGFYTFSAQGGVPPYVFSMADGNGAIDAETGEYTASDEPGTDVVRVTDAVEATSDCTVTVVVSVGFAISPVEITLPAKASTTFVASGGAPPFAFAVSEGAGTIDSTTGEYVAPDESGTDTVRVEDAVGNSDEATVTIVSSLEFVISPLAITLYVNNGVGFAAFGGNPPYTFAVVSGGGTIDEATGLYTAAADPSVDTVRAPDSKGSTSDATVTVYAPFAISPASVTLTVNSAFTFTASGGLSPYVFTMVSGEGTIDADTALYAAPSAPSNDVVKAVDSLGNSATAAVIVTAPAPLLISPSSLFLNVDDTHTFTAAGGRAPYAFDVVLGTGTIDEESGLYTAPASAESGTVRVTDDLGATSDASVEVVESGPLSIFPDIVVVEQTQTAHFSAAGGVPGTGYSFTVLPGGAGGTINASTGVFVAPLSLGESTVRVTDSTLPTPLSADATVSIAPLAPSGLSADGAFGGPQDVRLTWFDGATGEDGFSVERDDGEGSGFLEIAVVAANETFYDDEDSKDPQGLYFYRVRAFAGTTYSGYSNEDWAIPN